MRFLALLLIVLATYPVSAQEADTSPVAVMVGSSSACGPFGARIAAEIRTLTGRRVRSLCHSATGLARPDAFDWQEEIEGYRLPATRVVLFLGGNDAQGLRYLHRREWRWIRWREEAEWRTLYTERTRALIDTMCDRGASHVVVVLPPPVLQERLEGRLGRVRESLEAGTRASRCGSVLPMSGLTTATDAAGELLFSGRGLYLADEVHLSRRGSEIAWGVVGSRLLSTLGLPTESEPVPEASSP